MVITLNLIVSEKLFGTGGYIDKDNYFAVECNFFGNDSNLN